MGTRHLIIVKKDNTEKVCQYGQWDGYLSGQGKTVYAFCKNILNIEKLRRMLDLNLIVLYDDTKEKPISIYNQRVHDDTMTPKDRYWYDNFIHRDVGGDILSNLINCDFNSLSEYFEGKIGLFKYEDYEKLVNYHDIYIEYAYIIDLDSNRLEVWAYGKKIKDCDLYHLPLEEDFLKKQKEEG